MIGFWIFVIVLVICITIVICVFLQNEGTSKWAMRRELENIASRLSRIDKALEEIGRKGGAE